MAETQREDIDAPHLDVEKAWEKAKFLKQDLDKGVGWTQRYQIVNEYNSWTKTFPNEEVRVKLLYRYENMPMSAEKFIEMMSADKREWDKNSVLEILEKLPNGGCIARSVLNLSFPLSDRDYILYISPPYETSDWFGKKAFAIFILDATHPSRPAGADGVVRATNGGNFYIAVQDEEEPGHKCETFMLSTNNYNGWVPKSNERLVAKKAPKHFYHIRQDVVEGYNEYFNN
ncbi:uncharacterized protein LOC110053142 [Paramuricea clavata]|uniref:Uncharacterized protein LOC110053142 n=1 Tax=Paramuricea clavata TaxID=317549 RepID=A0A7D9EA59_PARCT|nr:uncharacterized protein LOC110053142 [Paramuricea clavata]